MLPIAARVGAHIYGERRAGREPIFDMNVSVPSRLVSGLLLTRTPALHICMHICTCRVFQGITLQPPHPGPWAGAPMGGLGSGALGRGRYLLEVENMLSIEILIYVYRFFEGYRGDVRRWSIHPGRYVHRSSPAVAQLALRVTRQPPASGEAQVHSKVDPSPLLMYED